MLSAVFGVSTCRYFEAESAEVVAAANERAEAPFARIVNARRISRSHARGAASARAPSEVDRGYVFSKLRSFANPETYVVLSGQVVDINDGGGDPDPDPPLSPPAWSSVCDIEQSEAPRPTAEREVVFRRFLDLAVVDRIWTFGGSRAPPSLGG